MESNRITFLFDLEPASPSNMPPADDFVSLLAIPSPNKFEPPLLSPLDIAKLGPFRSLDLVSPITLFFESENEGAVTHPPTLEAMDLFADNPNLISYELYSPMDQHYTEDSDASSRSATPYSVTSMSEPLAPRSSRAPSPEPSSASNSSPFNSRRATPEFRPLRPSKPKRAAISKSRTPASVGRRSTVSAGSSRSWSEAENRACINLMRQVCSEPKFQGKESRFVEVGRRMLKDYGFSRPNVKNQWNRYLRVRCGFEDRGEKKRGGGVVTSALGRKRKRAAVIEDEDEPAEADEKNDLTTADADDEDDNEDEKQDATRPASRATNRAGWRPLGGKSYGGKVIPGHVPSSSQGGKSYIRKPSPRKTLPSKPVTKSIPRKTINAKSLSINTNNHSYTGGKSFWPSIENEAEYIVISDSEPCLPSSRSTYVSDGKGAIYAKGSRAEDFDVNGSDDEDGSEHESMSPLPYFRRRLKRTSIARADDSDNDDDDSGDSDAEYNSPAPAPKKRKIIKRDAAVAADLQRAWGLGLRRRG